MPKTYSRIGANTTVTNTAEMKLLLSYCTGKGVHQADSIKQMKKLGAVRECASFYQITAEVAWAYISRNFKQYLERNKINSYPELMYRAIEWNERSGQGRVFV